MVISYLYKNEIVINKALTRAMGVFTFILLLSLGAYIRLPLPFTPVPITLQTFFVLLCGALMGRKYAPIATFSYLVLGVLGLPIFQGYGRGMLHIFGPTGGYLIGFVAASFVIGYLIDLKRDEQNLWWIIFSMAAGKAIIYSFGIIWLSLSMHIGLTKAVYLGFVPFIPGAIFKLLSASLIYSKIS